MTDHKLSPLLEPRSIAIVGASPREHSTGQSMLRTLKELRFGGPVYPINPRYEQIEGLTCYSGLEALPAPVDLAVLAVSNERLEEQLEKAIKVGAKAAAIFGSCVMPEDRDPCLADRLSALARNAGLPICGGNSMGLCNYEARIHVNSYPFIERRPGPVTFLSQSGSVFAAIVNHNHRIGLNFAVSTGRELSTHLADYMDYALGLDSTRAIGIFLETVRDPDAFRRSLGRAQARGVPVVALKVGRSEQAAQMAVSHSGALAGNDMAYGALFERHGVARVETIDELVSTLLLMSQPRPFVTGSVATIHESGGERELVVDLAADIGIPFAAINDETKAKLAARLDYGLDPVNPLDAFGTGNDYGGILRDCFQALLEDPDTGIGMFFLDMQQGNLYSETCIQACLDAAALTPKPVVLATNYAAVDHQRRAVEVTRAGVPVLDGTVPALRAVRHALDYRDFRRRPEISTPAPPSAAVSRRWKERLARGGLLTEAEGLALLADYGIPVLPYRLVVNLADARQAANALGYPVVLKTAMPDISHKSDVGGVMLNLTDEAAVERAYLDLEERLGSHVLVTRFVRGGVELVLGLKMDPQFGPLILVGAGGILVELMRDVQASLAPIDEAGALRMIDKLKVRKLLAGMRGAAPSDMDALASAILRLSALALDLKDHLAEIDINPLLVRPQGCAALDALVVPAKRPAAPPESATPA
jgi:acetate---CoA ligase (ADP-forming)